MVNYKLGIYNKKEARIIDLDKIIKISKLENLDEFTSDFNNEDEFKLYLLNKGLITNYELKQNISVMYKYSGKIKKLPIIFQDMKKYLDIFYLKAKLLESSQNLELLEKLARHYSIGSEKHNPQGVNVSSIRGYISDVRSNDGNHFYSKPLEYALDDMWKKAVFKSSGKTSDIVNKSTGEIKENYRGSRDLGLFLYKYNKQTKLQEEQQEIKVELKKQTTNEDEWIQSSMFDDIEKQNIILDESNEDVNIYNKWVLSSDGEPDFPPNSEEEANYKRYLERLDEISNNEPIENHPHYRR